VKLGISEAQARIYVALLEKRELSAMEIHEQTHVPRSKVYEITRNMMLKGMCIEKTMGRNKKYQAVEPRRAFNNILAEQDRILQEKKSIASSISKMFSPLYSQGMQNVSVFEYVEIIRDMASIHERYVSLLKNTRHEQLGFVKPPFSYQVRRKLQEQENTELEILKKGVMVRVLYEYSSRDLGELYEHVKKCTSAGERARVVEKLPIKMYVFDRRYVLMALPNRRAATSLLTMLVIDNPALANALKILFDHLWEGAYEYQFIKSLIDKHR
jgi:sugar-specific transcriptional regulator TrmB